MKQVLQSLKNGETQIATIPMPQVKAGHVLIQTSKSLISPGTEKMLVAFGEASLLQKARSQPDKVKQVLTKIKTDGLATTVAAIRDKLDQLIPMGYSNVGTVIAKGNDVENFAIGDRVVSNGAHAEIVSVPENLCCKIPETVKDDEAVFTILGAICLQGIRLAAPLLGESFVVIGCGLIGLLTIQLLRAQGVSVLALDVNADKLALAETFGAKTLHLQPGSDVISASATFSRGRGVDGVLITCATDSNEPVSQAAKMCRKRGRIILVGVAGLSLSRADFYEKELSFQVSCAYGPGRYDYNYEKAGLDYPIGFVRFTAQRNFEAFLDLLSARQINVAPLISKRFNIEDAEEAYDALTNDQNALGLLLAYPATIDQTRTTTVGTVVKRKDESAVRVGFIGAGNYALRTLIPAFNVSANVLEIIASENGVSGVQAANRFNITHVTTDTDYLLSTADINTVVIATRHDTHADFVTRALATDKHVFVEKPLCLNEAELTAIESALLKSDKLLMVGFNRRFAPHIQKMKTLLDASSQPKSFIMTVNALAIPETHWTQSQTIGGGRILGEACHFIDLLRYLSGAAIESFQVATMGKANSTRDKTTITLNFTDGSFGTIHYFANGHASFPKERLEVFANGKILQLDNFRKLRGVGWPGFKRMHLWRQDKGQVNCVRAFIHAIKHGLASPIPRDEIIEVARTTIAIARTLA